jgi:hypothetical protein
MSSPSRTFDALVFDYYDGQHLICVARTCNGFTPSSREALFRQFKDLETTGCPFVNLPEARSGAGVRVSPAATRLREGHERAR